MALKVCNDSNRPITVGNGQYIVYHQNAQGEKTAPSRQAFEAAYAVMTQFNSPLTDNRYAVIRGKIKAIDPSLEITFVPRTIYELQFIKQGIKEDLSRNDYCLNECTPPNPYSRTPNENCWHIAYFDREEDNNAEAVKLLAFKLNQNLFKKIKKCHLDQSALQFKSIAALSDKQIAYFKKLYGSNLHQNKGFQSTPFSEGTPIQKFIDSRLGIGSDQDARIVQNAVALECHPIAENAFLLYRGTEFSTDLPYSPNNPNEPYSFSFGGGLFAGTLFSLGATAFHYAKSSKEGYVMLIPKEEMALFDYPKKHPICHLASNHGVIFHPRSKIWKTNGEAWGFGGNGRIKEIVEPYFCDLDRETLTDQVLKFKSDNVVLLKSSDFPVMAIPRAFQPKIQILANIPLGRSLFLRGDAAGLSWQKGQPMTQIDQDRWILRLQNPGKGEFKALIDDKVFEEGSNHKFDTQGPAVTEAPYFNEPSQPSGKSTRLTVRYNAGIGNSLSIRGDGPGMSWDHGPALKNIGEDLWIWESSDYTSGFQYKLVANNTKWESGPNHRVKFGQKEEVIPRF